METLRKLYLDREFNRLCYENMRDCSPETFQYLANVLLHEQDCSKLLKELQKNGVPKDELIIFAGVLNYLVAHN